MKLLPSNLLLYVIPGISPVRKLGERVAVDKSTGPALLRKEGQATGAKSRTFHHENGLSRWLFSQPAVNVSIPKKDTNRMATASVRIRTLTPRTR